MCFLWFPSLGGIRGGFYISSPESDNRVGFFFSWQIIASPLGQKIAGKDNSKMKGMQNFV